MVSVTKTYDDFQVRVNEDSNAVSVGVFHPWLKVWESASVLTNYISNLKHLPRFNRAIELGSGTGIVGIALSLQDCADQVYLTDLPCALDDLTSSLSLNMELHCSREYWISSSSTTRTTVEPLCWGSAGDANALTPPFDLILASDVIYFDHLFKPLIQTLLHLSDRDSLILISYKIRSFKEMDFFAQFGRFFSYEASHLTERGDDYYMIIARRRPHPLDGDCDQFYCMRLMSTLL